MDRLVFPGKGTKESIDHINRNGLDNRKENLRLVTQSAQNINQKQKERRIELPVDSGVIVDEIPKHVWYIKANGAHGDRFGIDLHLLTFQTPIISIFLCIEINQKTYNKKI